jgi:hypothetical protein
MKTPWGYADFVENIHFIDDYYKNIDTGVIQVSTPSHGGIGIRIEEAENKYKISNYAKNQAIKAHNYYWFEEDCNWAIAVIELETFDIFTLSQSEDAYECAKRWHKNYIAA